MALKNRQFLIIAVIFLGAAVIIYFLNTRQTFSEDIYKEKIVNRIRSELGLLKSELTPVFEAVKEDRISFTGLNSQTKYPFYIFKDRQPVYWSDQRYVPEYRTMVGEESVRFFESTKGKYLAYHRTINDYEVFSIIPLFEYSKITNQYVSTFFNDYFFEGIAILITSNPEITGDILHITFDDDYLFTIQYDPAFGQEPEIKGYLVTVLAFLGIIALLFYLVRQVNYLLNTKRADVALLLFFGSLVVLRVVMLRLEFPMSQISPPVFDSIYYASSKYNPTLGDLFFNIVCFLAMAWYLFRYYTRTFVYRKLLTASPVIKLIVAAILIGFGLMLLNYHYHVFRTIYHNSQWTYNITGTIVFSFLRVVIFLIFLIDALIFFLVFHVIYRTVERILSRRKTIIALVGGSVMYLGYAMGYGLPFIVIGSTFLIYYLVLLGTNVPKYLGQLRYNAFLYFFMSGMVSAIVGANSIYLLEDERNTISKEKFANQFLVENDPLAEMLLSEAMEQIRNDVFIKSRLFSSFFSKEQIVQKVQRVYLSNYFDKYDVQIYMYNANGEPLENYSTEGSYLGIRNAFDKEMYQTEYNDIFFVNRVGADVTKRYLAFVPIDRYDIPIGHLILDLNLKKIIPRSVYPELLVDNRFIQNYRNKDFSYAVFANNRITYNSGDFNYLRNISVQDLESEDLRTKGIRRGGYEHLGVVDSEGRTILVSSKLFPFNNILSNFSFLFLIIVFFIIILITIFTLFNTTKEVRLNYAGKIQLYLNVSFFLPLFIVSIITLSLITSSFKREHTIEYFDKTELMASNISIDLNNYLVGRMEREALSNKLALIAKNAGLDANLYDMNGRLIATSQPTIYQYELLSEFMNPWTMETIKEGGAERTVIDESVGSLVFNAVYITLKSFDTGRTLGILSIPFFESAYYLEQQQITVFTNIMDIFTVIFILFLVVSNFASKRLTLPLEMITQKLKRTTLSEENEPLDWKSDDEIGLMVTEYNKMLVNLERSKRALARSEKESAWREMAQQVAHEIKNPLTPMKLTLQQLQRRIVVKNNEDNKDIERPLKSLLRQVDTLNDIASSFSSFAKMPIPENKKFELMALLRQTFRLHKNTENSKIEFKDSDDELYTIGDEKLMGRIVSNIIINSIQSAPDGVEVKVTGSVVTHNNKVTIKIKDNGKGIPDSIQEKVFMPNFSTKDEGSGIGLAIAKHGVEHAGGSIWFESGEKKGTTFFIELPLVD